MTRRETSQVQGGTGAFLVVMSVLLVLLLLLFSAIDYVVKIKNAITVETAIERFYELSDAENIEVVRHSNLNWLGGDPRHGKFELLIDGKKIQGECSSDFFSPMICLLYTGGDE